MYYVKTFLKDPRMQRIFRKKREAAATRAATEQDPPQGSHAAGSSSTKAFPFGIKLLHTSEAAVVECVHLRPSELKTQLIFPA